MDSVKLQLADEVQGNAALLDSQLEFGITAFSSGIVTLLIRTTNAITLRSKTGQLIFTGGTESEITVGSGIVTLIDMVDDVIQIDDKDGIYDFYVNTGTGVTGMLWGIKNIFTDSFQEFGCTAFNNDINLGLIANADLETISNKGGYGKTSDFTECTSLHTFAVNQGNFSGDIALMPASITALSAVLTAVTGNLNDLQSKAIIETISLNYCGINIDLDTMTGFAALQSFTASDSTVHGDIANTATSMPILVTMSAVNRMRPDNIYGDIGSTPTPLTSLISNTSTLLTYVTRKTWAANMIKVDVRLLDSTQIDNLLIDLAATTWTGSKVLTVREGTRTSSSDAAVSTLEGLGVTVTVNE